MPVPPREAQTEAQRGLDWRSEFGRGGTAVGIARARDISNGVDLSMDTVRRMSSYFARHEVDKQGEGWSPDEPGYPSNGRIAWALWGGDSARAWADRLIADDSTRTLMDETREIEGMYPLSPLQVMQYEHDEHVVEVFGKLDQGIGERGAHYVAESPFADEGIICSSCAFYEGPRACEIVDGDIDPAGICKRWVIPETLLTIGEAQGPATEPMDAPMTDTATVRYGALEVEQRRIGGRDVEFRTVEVGPLEVRIADGTEDAPKIVGYAAVFNSDSEPLPNRSGGSFIETIAPGAFKRSLGSGREVRAFINHDLGQVLATSKNDSLRLAEDERGLLVEADLPNTTAGRDLAELVRTGTVHSWSFGFSIPKGGDTWRTDPNTGDERRELREVILHEVSIVTGFPAYPGTEGTVVRSTESPADEPAERRLPVALAQRILDLNAKR